MITIVEAVKKIIKHSPLLDEGLSRGLMNTSAVARSIRSQVEQMTRKQVSEGAIVMTLQRLLTQLPQSDSQINHLNHNSPEMVIRSHLFECTVANSSTLLGKQRRLLALAADHNNQYFMTITTGVFETTIIASDALQEKINTILTGETKVSQIDALSSITIRLDKNTVAVPGLYAHILKQLLWEGVNVVEVVSTYLELTIVVHQDEAARTFSVLKTTA